MAGSGSWAENWDERKKKWAELRGKQCAKNKPLYVSALTLREAIRKFKEMYGVDVKETDILTINTDLESGTSSIGDQEPGEAYYAIKGCAVYFVTHYDEDEYEKNAEYLTLCPLCLNLLSPSNSNSVKMFILEEEWIHYYNDNPIVEEDDIDTRLEEDGVEMTECDYSESATEFMAIIH